MIFLIILWWERCTTLNNQSNNVYQRMDSRLQMWEFALLLSYLATHCSLLLFVCLLMLSDSVFFCFVDVVCLLFCLCGDGRWLRPFGFFFCLFICLDRHTFNPFSKGLATTTRERANNRKMVGNLHEGCMYQWVVMMRGVMSCARASC